MYTMLTTETVPHRQRAGYWEDMIRSEFVAARCRPTTGSDFNAAIRSAPLDMLALCHVRSSGTRILRTREDISASIAHYFLLSIQLEGTGNLEQAGRSLSFGPGDMALYDTSRSYELSYAGDQRQMVLRIPRDALVSRCRRMASVGILGIPGRVPAAGLVRDLVTKVAELQTGPSDRSQRSIALTLLDLILDCYEELVPSSSQHKNVLRLEEAIQLADRHLADPEFSVGIWASRLGISERYLRAIFRARMESPAEYIWARRLEDAARRLRDPGSSHLAVTVIALESGFNSSSHFSYAFRSRYNMTPSEYRASTSPQAAVTLGS